MVYIYNFDNGSIHIYSSTYLYICICTHTYICTTCLYIYVLSTLHIYICVLPGPSVSCRLAVLITPASFGRILSKPTKLGYYMLLSLCGAHYMVFTACLLHHCVLVVSCLTDPVFSKVILCCWEYSILFLTMPSLQIVVGALTASLAVVEQTFFHC